MLQHVEEVVAALRSAVAAIDPARLRALDAERIVEALAEGERLCQAGRAVAAQRVLRTRFWRAQGFRTPAQWLASRTRGPLGQAITAVETAHRLDSFPETRSAFVSGRLSEAQAAAITSASSADPTAEPELLALAERETYSELRDRCREVRAAAIADEDVNERIRRGRFVRHWSDRDGAVRLDARLSPDDGGRLLATLEARAARLQQEARKSGQTEPAEAYVADALVGLSSGSPGPKAVVHVHVDKTALERGRTIAGETCRIDGVGPVPVSTARSFIMDGIVKALADDGADVHAVAHLGRAIPAKLRTALEARDESCVVPGCEVRSGLEIDHIVPLSRGGPTALHNLARLCRYHHAQKTHRGWRLEGGPGEWVWTDPRGTRSSVAAPQGARAP